MGLQFLEKFKKTEAVLEGFGMSFAWRLLSRIARGRLKQSIFSV